MSKSRALRSKCTVFLWIYKIDVWEGKKRKKMWRQPPATNVHSVPSVPDLNFTQTKVTTSLETFNRNLLILSVAPHKICCLVGNILDPLGVFHDGIHCCPRWRCLSHKFATFIYFFSHWRLWYLLPLATTKIYTFVALSSRTRFTSSAKECHIEVTWVCVPYQPAFARHRSARSCWQCSLAHSCWLTVDWGHSQTSK